MIWGTSTLASSGAVMAGCLQMGIGDEALIRIT